MGANRHTAAVLAATILCSCGDESEPPPAIGFSMEIAGPDGGKIKGDSGRYGPSYVGDWASTGHRLLLEPVTGSPIWLQAEQIMIEIDNGGYSGSILGARPIGTVGLSSGTALADMLIVGAAANLDADSGTVTIEQYGPRRVRGSVDVWVSGGQPGGNELGPRHLTGTFVADSTVPPAGSNELSALGARVVDLIGA